MFLEGDSLTRFGRQLGTLAVGLVCTLLLLALAPGAFGMPLENAVDKGPAGAPYAAGELIVTYKQGTSERTVESASEKAGAKIEKDLSALNAKLVELPEIKSESSQEMREQDLAQAKDELEKDSAVENVYYNYVRTGFYTPNDSKFRYQYGLRKPGFEKAWSRTRGKQRRIAIVDSGADLGHVDLRNKAVAQYDFHNDNSTVEDPNGHGTHVAGIVAANTGNGFGVAGGCPGCRLVIAKALDKDLVGYDSDIATAIRWSADRGAKAINLSLGGTGEKSILSDAVNYAMSKGALVVAAAGNGGPGPIYPAAYRNVMAVAATGPSDNRNSSYSTGDYIDISAPGLNIISTVPGGYEYKSGTSMATPHVAALAGLLASQGRGPLNIRRRILRTSVDLGPKGRDPYYGAGRINADEATRK